MKQLLLFIVFIFSVCICFSQEIPKTGIILYGEVTEYNSRHRPDSVKIEVYYEHTGWKTICYSDKKGKWDSVYLAYENNYMLRLSHKNYFSKTFDLILTGFSDSLKNVIYRVNADTKLILRKSKSCEKSGLEHAMAATLKFRQWTGLPEWYENSNYEYQISNWKVCEDNVEEYEKQYSLNNTELTIKGRVGDKITGAYLKCPEIKLYKNDTLIKSEYPDHYKFLIKKIKYGFKYKLEINHNNYISRNVIIDLTGIPDTIPKTKDLEIDMNLVEKIPSQGCDTSFIKLPSGIIKYSKYIEDLEWDMYSVDRYWKAMERFLKCVEEKRKYIERN